MAELDGQIAFVTGAGSGLGREIALTFARAGARVAVNDLRAEPAAAVHAQIAEIGGARALRAARGRRIQLGRRAGGVSSRSPRRPTAASTSS
jgi:NAD(P)-dependent dehydrogenase (short-subunit alcohol dehydrogenase family)